MDRSKYIHYTKEGEIEMSCNKEESSSQKVLFSTPSDLFLNITVDRVINKI
jgi:hypothetical protein